MAYMKARCSQSKGASQTDPLGAQSAGVASSLAAQPVDTLLDAVSAAGVGRLDCLRDLAEPRQAVPESAALIEALLRPGKPILTPQEAEVLRACSVAAAPGEMSPTHSQLERAARSFADVRPLPASVCSRLVSLLRPSGAASAADDAVAAALLAPLLVGKTLGATLGGWGAAHVLLLLLGDRSPASAATTTVLPTPRRTRGDPSEA